MKVGMETVVRHKGGSHTHTTSGRRTGGRASKRAARGIFIPISKRYEIKFVACQ